MKPAWARHLPLFVIVPVLMLSFGASRVHAQENSRLCADIAAGNIVNTRESVEKSSELDAPECLNNMTPLMTAAQY